MKIILNIALGLVFVAASFMALFGSGSALTQILRYEVFGVQNCYYLTTPAPKAPQKGK